jgi:hypothetical protein
LQIRGIPYSEHTCIVFYFALHWYIDDSRYRLKYVAVLKYISLCVHGEKAFFVYIFINHSSVIKYTNATFKRNVVTFGCKRVLLGLRDMSKCYILLQKLNIPSYLLNIIVMLYFRYKTCLLNDLRYGFEEIFWEKMGAACSKI